jgi:hypothetical protein
MEIPVKQRNYFSSKCVCESVDRERASCPAPANVKLSLTSGL